MDARTEQTVGREGIARDLERLFEARQTGDYDYHITFDADEADAGMENLDRILEAIRTYVEAHFGIVLEPLTD